jgi:hypothetical protein
MKDGLLPYLFMPDIVKGRNAWNAYCGIPLKNTYDYQQASSKKNKRDWL